MSRVVYEQLIGFSRPILITGIGATIFVAVVFYFCGLHYGYMSPIEAVMAPTFSVIGLFICMGFLWAKEERLPLFLNAFILLGGLVILLGLIEGGLTTEGNFEFYLIWVPVFYVGAIFGAASDSQRKWSVIYFIVSSISLPVALALGPRNWSDKQSLLLLFSIIGSAVLLMIFTFLEKRMRENAIENAKLVAERESADALREAAENAEEARNEAFRANAAKSSFIANMSHELRTPLNAILGFSQLLQQRDALALSAQKQIEYARDIRFSADHLLGVINDMLDLSKIEAGKIELADDTVHMDIAFKEALTIMSRMIKERAIDLVTDVEDGLPALTADARSINQIILNLLSNAVKFTPKGGRVTMQATRASDGGIQVKIADTGIGMDAQTLARVMEPFEQGEVVYARQHGGTGLGLPLVKSLAALHGARIDIDCAEGKGTSVSIFFPKNRVAQTETHTKARD